MNSTGEWVTAAVQVLGDSSAGLVIETSAAGSTTASNGLGSICFQVSEGYGPVVSVLPASGYEGDTINFAFYASLEDNCASPPPYEPPAFAVLYVQANQSIAVMGMGRNGLLSLSRSSAVAIPGEDFTFSSGSSIFRLETQLTDQQYLTTAGMCNIGQWCSVPDGSLSYMVNITEVLELPATHWKLQSGGLVTMQAAHGYGLTTTGNDIVMTFDDDDLAISESDLDELEVTPLAFVDFITARDFALWPQANDQAKLAYHVDVGQGADFYTYTECDEDDETYDCDHIFDISFRDFLYYHLEHPTALSSIERLHMAFKAPREAQQRNLEQPAFELLV
eukprot:CAMPEP_0114620868 /NCGR_PEP_ID=MMETSP0168-20121206/8943_1 /TAXON_ID=95228 ORGANISM="Vannella sp., Strain DIVA3 517/6/12" /NCGR_SAMPLE_ID=MMETSP0168 /ASSEMBLY_ACC=CAM_ASM_000044 /LENGTH=334 /DNA_ID=CAMNT_0001832065 /DNA_START=188 /DNA_END=1192 /DNA_ORIENTATION=-